MKLNNILVSIAVAALGLGTGWWSYTHSTPSATEAQSAKTGSAATVAAENTNNPTAATTSQEISHNPAISQAQNSNKPIALADWAFNDLTGKTVTLASLTNAGSKPILINFWATWCPPCLKEMPELIALQKQFPEVQFVGIAIDNLDSVTKYQKKSPVNYLLWIGSTRGLDLSKLLGNEEGVLPQTTLLLANGTVKYNKIGVIKADILTTEIQSILKTK
jgi:thiol-disulfide isomerase/thioredoxin